MMNGMEACLVVRRTVYMAPEATGKTAEDNNGRYIALETDKTFPIQRFRDVTGRATDLVQKSISFCTALSQRISSAVIPCCKPLVAAHLCTYNTT